MMVRTCNLRTASLLSLLLCASGCQALWGRFNTPHHGGDLGPQGDAAPGGKPPIDVLFLIDNSPGTFFKQQTLAQQIAPFFRSLDALGADYHVGIATSDVGSFPAGMTFNPPTQDYHCQSEDGDNGMLQHTACTANAGRLSAEAQTACNTLCPDGRFVPSDPYIAGSPGTSNVPTDMQGGDGGAAFDNGPVRAFQCLALVGDQGCDIEGTLEGARRALNGRNAGFLRPNSIIVVIFLTDEDDCSVSPSGRIHNDPASSDCGAAAGKGATYSCFNPDFRCLAMAVDCNEDMVTTGMKTNCKPLGTSYLQPVSYYAAFFQGLRADPDHRLVIGGIWAPGLGGPGSQFLVQQLVPGGTPGLNRGVLDEASCYDTATGIFARPQLRLTSFLDNFHNGFDMTICDPAHYAQNLSHLSDRLGELISE